MHEEALIHGCCLSLDGDGVLLLGAPGAGKSDLALRLIDQPGSGVSGHTRHARLVADDQIVIRRRNGRLVASAPPSLFGRLEIRGLGIVSLAAVPEAELKLAVRLTPSAEVERMPDLARSLMEILGLPLPLVLIDPASASAPARIRAALDHLGGA